MATSIQDPVYKDIRSASRRSTRSSNLSHKYYSYRGVHPSWVGQPTYYVPTALSEHTFPPFVNASAPLVTYSQQMRIRTWTKRDQYLDREYDIFPLDRKTHKVGRRHRGRNCDYVPARWAEERCVKQRRREIEWEVEQAHSIDAAVRQDIEEEELEFRYWPGSSPEREGLLVGDWRKGIAPVCESVIGETPGPMTDIDGGETGFEVISLADRTDAEESDWEML